MWVTLSYTMSIFGLCKTAHIASVLLESKYLLQSFSDKPVDIQHLPPKSSHSRLNLGRSLLNPIIGRISMHSHEQTIVPVADFKPGAIWRDTDGVVIQVCFWECNSYLYLLIMLLGGLTEKSSLSISVRVSLHCCSQVMIFRPATLARCSSLKLAPADTSC